MYPLIGLTFVTLLFYSLHRLTFLIWNWSYYQNTEFPKLLSALMHGLRFDLSVISMVALLSFLLWLILFPFQRAKWAKALPLVLFVILQIPLMIINIGDAEFVSFMGRRFTVESLITFRELPGKFWQIAFSYLSLFLAGLFLISLFLYFGFKISQSEKFQLPARSQKMKWLMPILFFVFLFLGARGGLQKKPLGFAHAQVFSQPMMNNLVLNSAFTLVQSSKKQTLPRVRFFESTEQYLPFLNGATDAKSVLEGNRFQGQMNIVLIIVESLNYDYMGKPHGVTGFTPFLDSLSEQGVLFHHFFANGRRSIEGIASILAGIPALMNEPFVSSQYMANYFLGIGTLLTKQNFHTSFFHGGHNGTMYFDSFIQSVGIQNYFGYNEYPMRPGHDDGTWGVYDEPFLGWTAEKLNTFPQPFFSGIFTLTSHNPYKIPDEYKGKFPKGDLDILESIGYVDYSLKLFFDKIKSAPWYNNTLFIITGDHTDKSALKQFNNEIGRYRVPLILFHPQWKIPQQTQHQLAQQIDILPTILDILNIQVPEKNYLNQSLFVPGNRSVVFYNDLKYRLLQKDKLMTADQNLEHFQFYSFQDPAESIPLVLTREEQLPYINTLKAHVQYFSEGLWDNRLYYPVAK